MNRTWLLLLLLTTGVALADDPPAKQAPPAAPAKRPDGAAKAAPAKKDAAPAKAEPAKAEPAKKDTDPAKKDAESAKNEAEGAAKPEADDKTKHDADLGMSILGNQEAPKSLVIVPWKSSEIGQGLGISTLLDDSRQPIDKEVFMRVLSYYELTTTTHRRKP